MALLDRIRMQIALGEIVRRLREKTGVFTLTENHLIELASALGRLSKKPDRDNSWFEISLLILGAKSADLPYDELLERLPNSPIAQILHRWDILPYMHQILKDDERSYGLSARTANQLLGQRLEKALPAEYSGWLDDFRMVQAVSNPEVSLT
jgi:hypothetical protein